MQRTIVKDAQAPVAEAVSKAIARLGRETLLYGVGNALQQFLGFLLFPIYTRLLTPGGFGAQDLVATATTVATVVFIGGLDSATVRFYNDVSEDRTKKRIVSTWLWTEMLVAVPACLVLFLMARPISLVLFNDPELTPYLRLGVLAIPLSQAASICSMILRLTFQAGKYVIVQSSQGLMQIASAIVFVVILRWGVLGVFSANLIASGFGMIVALGFTWRYIGLGLSCEWLKRMLAFGLPLVPGALALWVLGSSNRLILARDSSLSEIGVLGVATRLSTIIVFALSAFEIAWGPFAYSLIGHVDVAKKTYSKVLKYFFLVACLATAAVSLFAREGISILATPAYEAAAPLVPWLSFSSVAWIGAYIVGMGYGIAKKSYHGSIAVLVGAVVTTALNFLLIPTWTIMGAVVAALAGQLAVLGYSFAIGQHYFPVLYETGRVGTIVGLSVSVVAGGLLVDRAFPIWTLEEVSLKIALFVLLVTIIASLRIVTREEMSALRAGFGGLVPAWFRHPR